MKVNYLGYYAMDKNKNLHKFRWNEDDTFYINKKDKNFDKGYRYIKADFKDYEILLLSYMSEQ